MKATKEFCKIATVNTILSIEPFLDILELVTYRHRNRHWYNSIGQLISTWQHTHHMTRTLKLNRITNLCSNEDSINWKTTLEIWRDKSPTTTSFEDSVLTTFQYKLLLDELPTIEKMKCLYPELFSDSLYPVCGHFSGTIIHTWRYPLQKQSLDDILVQIVTQLKEKFDLRTPTARILNLINPPETIMRWICLSKEWLINNFTTTFNKSDSTPNKR